MSESQKKFQNIVLTGDRPTGPLHLGHYVGSIQNRVALQDQYETCFYMVADVQALTDNADNPQKVRDNMKEVVLDNLACGVDPHKTTMFIQSMVPEIAELTVFFMNLVTVNQLSHNPTIKTEMKEKGFEESLPLGFLAYPVSQAADILFAKANTVPVGQDQMPVIEQANDIVKKFNAIYGKEVFPYISGVVGDHGRLVGTDGNAKASKSLGNAIFLSDTPEEIKKKVNSMFTCPSKIAVTDTVTAEELAGNVVFQYLDVFDQDTAGVEKMKEQYMNGEIGDSVGKARLIEVLLNLLNPIRERREELAKDPEYLEKILKEGIEKAHAHARQTMVEVREVMKIDYFDKDAEA
ncbi:tryptophan--tRNA ligase [Candidatus Nomurabacteria bacterium]|nr:tryptophan--tRNA ligase [Candidatus Nomurabacteria bacterium]